MDNTLIDYSQSVLEWTKINGMPQCDNTNTLKALYQSWGNYESEWLCVQEWLYTEGLRFASLTEGAEKVFTELKAKGFSLTIISHKSKLSANQKLDLHTPAKRWLEDLSSKFLVTLDGGIFFEESQVDKIERIRNEGVTHFLDDLAEVLTHIRFPRQIEKYWYTKNTNAVLHEKLQPISELSELLMYV